MAKHRAFFSGFVSDTENVMRSRYLLNVAAFVLSGKSSWNPCSAVSQTYKLHRRVEWSVLLLFQVNSFIVIFHTFTVKLC